VGKLSAAVEDAERCIELKPEWGKGREECNGIHTRKLARKNRKKTIRGRGRRTISLSFSISSPTSSLVLLSSFLFFFLVVLLLVTTNLSFMVLTELNRDYYT
jgi:hypothetical protein